jgi:hypothetical protein
MKTIILSILIILFIVGCKNNDNKKVLAKYNSIEGEYDTWDIDKDGNKKLNNETFQVISKEKNGNYKIELVRKDINRIIVTNYFSLNNDTLYYIREDLTINKNWFLIINEEGIDNDDKKFIYTKKE